MNDIFEILGNIVNVVYIFCWGNFFIKCMADIGGHMRFKIFGLINFLYILLGKSLYKIHG